MKIKMNVRTFRASILLPLAVRWSVNFTFETSRDVIVLKGNPCFLRHHFRELCIYWNENRVEQEDGKTDRVSNFNQVRRETDDKEGGTSRTE